MRGAFIVIEGCDRSGKSTQCSKLVEALNNQQILSKLITFPDRGTEVGRIIDMYLKKQIELPDQSIHLLFSANRWELVPKINELLHDGVNVIADRYSYSGVAYTAAKQVVDIEWCKNPETGLPKPDLVIYLHLSTNAMNERKGFGIERYESSAFQERVAEIYTSLKDNTWKVVDANKTIEDLKNELLTIIKETVESVTVKPLSVLW